MRLEKKTIKELEKLAQEATRLVSEKRAVMAGDLLYKNRKAIYGSNLPVGIKESVAELYGDTIKGTEE